MRRLWVWLLSFGRWPEIPVETRQAIEEQVRVRTLWVRRSRAD